MIGRPEYTLTLPPPCPTNRDHLTTHLGGSSSRLATYGCLASIYHRRHGHQIGALTVANARKWLYGLLTHDTRVPLHRIASEGDLHSKNDSPETQCYNRVLRGREGTYDGHDPWWWG